MIDYYDMYPEAFDAGRRAFMDFNCDEASRREAFDRINQLKGYGEQAAFVDGWTEAEKEAVAEAEQFDL